ncbi:MAG: hypothetical protein PSV46_14085 [Reyranella sp.]|nr:hypothetical protein [Reyranella sp.]
MALLTGACGAPLAVTAGGYAADGTLMATGNKTSSDHLASMMSKKDCSFVRVFRSTDVCREREAGTDPYAVDYNEPQRSVSEDGVKYGPPLRSAADVPATSWDAAAYKAAPAPAPPSPAPTEPVMAVTDSTPAPASAAPAAVPKAKKGKAVRAAKKPSRGQAAPAS